MEFPPLLHPEIDFSGDLTFGVDTKSLQETKIKIGLNENSNFNVMYNDHIYETILDTGTDFIVFPKSAKIGPFFYGKKIYFMFPTAKDAEYPHGMIAY